MTDLRRFPAGQGLLQPVCQQLGEGPGMVLGQGCHLLDGLDQLAAGPGEVDGGRQAAIKRPVERFLNRGIVFLIHYPDGTFSERNRFSF